MVSALCCCHLSALMLTFVRQVCRVSAQVSIKGVGLVSLAWDYLN